eukprot:gene2703-biopygen4318
MASNLSTELGIMIALLLGAWVVKVIGVAAYVFWSRRRLRRLQAEGGVGLSLPMMKPTPADVIRTLPVLPYASALQQLNSHANAECSREATEEPSQLPPATPTSATAEPEAGDPEADLSGAPPAGAVQNTVKTTSVAVEDCLPQQKDEEVASQAATLPSKDGSQAGGQQHLRPSDAPCTLPQALQHQAQSDVDDSDSCAICFCQYSSSTPVKQLPCKHFYHSECIDQWLIRDNTCPLCKAPVWHQPAPAARLHGPLARPENTTATSRVAIIDHHTGLHLVLFVPAFAHQSSGTAVSLQR